MDKDEILNRLGRLLWRHFPDEPHPDGPYWRQRPYLDDFFDLCIQAYNIVHRDSVESYVAGSWQIQRQNRLSTQHERQLEQLVDAWDDWQFAYQKLVVDERRAQA